MSENYETVTQEISCSDYEYRNWIKIVSYEGSSSGNRSRIPKETINKTKTSESIWDLPVQNNMVLDSHKTHNSILLFLLLPEFTFKKQ